MPVTGMRFKFRSAELHNSFTSVNVVKEKGSKTPCAKSFVIAFVSKNATNINTPCVYTTISFFVKAPVTKNNAELKNKVGITTVTKGCT